MKKKVFTKKLAISKETIATLSENEMFSVKAGAITIVEQTCLSDAKCCPQPQR